MLKSIVFAALFGAALFTTSTQASAGYDEYCTYISQNDKVASDGYKLSDPASILRQDRANFHKFKRRDRDDGSDRTFTSANARARIPALLDKANNDPAVLNAIVRRNIHVCVEVWSDMIVVYEN